MSDFAIEVRDLVKTYRRRGAPEVRAVDGLSFDVRAGAIFGLLGPNGAGKTTTLRVLTTLVAADRRAAPRPGLRRRRASRSRCGGASRSSSRRRAAELFLSVRDNLLTFARFHGLRRRRRSRRRADARARAVRPDGRRGPQGEDLSGGFRRRVQVAKMFMVDTPVVFLDEFSTGMDPILKRVGHGRRCATRRAAAGRSC